MLWFPFRLLQGGCWARNKLSRAGGWVGGREELEIRLRSGQRKLELGLGLSLAIDQDRMRKCFNIVKQFFKSCKKGASSRSCNTSCSCSSSCLSLCDLLLAEINYLRVVNGVETFWIWLLMEEVYERQPSMEQRQLRWMTTFNQRRPLMADDHLWKMTLDRRQAWAKLCQAENSWS